MPKDLFRKVVAQVQGEIYHEEIMKLLGKARKEMSSVHHCHLAVPVVSIVEEIIKILKRCKIIERSNKPSG